MEEVQYWNCRKKGEVHSGIEQEKGGAKAARTKAGRTAGLGS